MCACMLNCFSHVQLLATLWPVARQAPLSMGFSRQEYWRGLPCPSLGNLSDPGIKPKSLISAALAGGFFTTSTTCEAPKSDYYCSKPSLYYMIVELHDLDSRDSAFIKLEAEVFLIYLTFKERERICKTNNKSGLTYQPH